MTKTAKSTKTSKTGSSKAAGKRKTVAENLIDIAHILPVRDSFQLIAGTRTAAKLDFKSACLGRAVHVERLFSEKLLRDIKFPWLQRLKEWKMWDMFINDNEVITNAVKVFYFRGDTGLFEMRPNEEDPELPEVEVRVSETDRSFRTRIDEEVIHVDEDLIRRYIHDVPNDTPNDVPDESTFPYLVAFREILGDNELETTKDVKAEGMDLHNRILHLMVTQVLFPRCGDYSKARKRDIYWMWRIIKNDRPNVSAMIMTRMMEGMRNSKTNGNGYALPYGRLVSRICSDFCALHPDEPKTAPPFKVPFNQKSIAALGWKFDKTLQVYVRAKQRETETETQASSSTNPLESVLAAVGNLANRVEEVYQRQDVLAAQNRMIYDVLSNWHNDSEFIGPFPTFPPADNAP